MQLYAGSSAQFIEDAVQNQVAEKLKAAFLDHYRFQPSPGEVASWRNSLGKVKDVFQRAGLLDHGVALEYQLPLTSRRLDCMVTGRDKERADQALIVELKQWEECEPCEGDNEVLTFVGGAKRPALHPSVQVSRYESYLRDCHTAFYEGEAPVGLASCAYLHNYELAKRDLLVSPKFKAAVAASPVFGLSDVDALAGFMKKRLEGGEGLDVLDRIQKSKYRASKKLLEHVGAMVAAHKPFVLLDEQLVVFDRVMAAAKKGLGRAGKKVIVIHGGPGTGKSVIAINLMAELSRQGAQAHYATGSKAFTETLRRIVGARAAAQFKYFHNYATAEKNALDVLILDESHRIRKTSVSRFTPKDERSGLLQIEELLAAARVSVFFIDDYQVVRPREIGSSTLIASSAKAIGAEVEEYRLEAQFRCSGSEGFLNWIDNTLGVRKTANILWKGDPKFEFKLFDSPEELDAAIRAKATEGHSARLTAGYCWPWSDPRPDGTLAPDVSIGGWARPWNAKEGAGRLARGIPKAALWAYEPGGIDQVGCIYTAQGFEFDYVGVLFGRDLFYNPAAGAWEGRKEFCEDPAVAAARTNFAELIKNTYRVLLSRGMKGCYVHFLDEETKAFFLSRMESEAAAELAAVPKPIEILPEIEPAQMYRGYLPVYSLAAAAGGFSEAQSVRPLGWTAVDRPGLTKSMFVARVKGRSMEPTIPDGAYCVFRTETGGSRDGKIVLVESGRVSDPDTSARYTVKRYRSEKELFEDGTWRHKRITLSADNPEYEDIVLENVEPTEFRVAAELVAVLG